MSPFIMIVVTSLGWGGTAVMTQEFQSEQACTAAAKITGDKIDRFGGGKNYSVFCVPKGPEP